MMNLELSYLKTLPYGSSLEIVDASAAPLDVEIYEKQHTDGTKDVELVVYSMLPLDRRVCHLDLKHLHGFCDLTANWKEKREDLYQYAITQCYDNRWQVDKVFRMAMYNEYINVDIPITLRLGQLDQANQKVVFNYVNDVLMRGTESHYVSTGICLTNLLKDKE